MLFKMFTKRLALAEICRNIAEVLFASVFIGSIITSDINWGIGVLGLMLAIVLWLISLFLEKN